MAIPLKNKLIIPIVVLLRIKITIETKIEIKKMNIQI